MGGDHARELGCQSETFFDFRVLGFSRPIDPLLQRTYVGDADDVGHELGTQEAAHVFDYMWEGCAHRFCKRLKVYPWEPSGHVASLGFFRVYHVNYGPITFEPRLNPKQMLSQGQA